jgi:hypothetical protein
MGSDNTNVVRYFLTCEKAALVPEVLEPSLVGRGIRLAGSSMLSQQCDADGQGNTACATRLRMRTVSVSRGKATGQRDVRHGELLFQSACGAGLGENHDCKLAGGAKSFCDAGHRMSLLAFFSNSQGLN